jgi:hypothetical protein
MSINVGFFAMPDYNDAKGIRAKKIASTAIIAAAIAIPTKNLRQ